MKKTLDALAALSVAGCTSPLHLTQALKGNHLIDEQRTLGASAAKPRA
jgi:hypothetical protein